MAALDPCSSSSQCRGWFDPAETGDVVECPIRGDDRRQAVPKCGGGVHRIPAAEAVDVRNEAKGGLQNRSIEVMQHAQLCDITSLPDGRRPITPTHPVRNELLHHFYARM